MFLHYSPLNPRYRENAFEARWELTSLCLMHGVVCASYLPFDTCHATIMERVARAFAERSCAPLSAAHAAWNRPDGDHHALRPDPATRPGLCGASCSTAAPTPGEDRSCWRFCRHGQCAVLVVLAIGLVLLEQSVQGVPHYLP